MTSRGYDQSDQSKQATMDEENKEADPWAAVSKIEVEWANLGDELTIDPEKRYLYDWYRNVFKLDTAPNMEESHLDFPFPSLSEDNEISKNILRFILYKIKSEQYVLPKCMKLAASMLKQIVDEVFEDPYAKHLIPLKNCDRNILDMIRNIINEILAKTKLKDQFPREQMSREQVQMVEKTMKQLEEEAIHLTRKVDELYKNSN